LNKHAAFKLRGDGMRLARIFNNVRDHESVLACDPSKAVTLRETNAAIAALKF
jgi:hypothetical protein